MKSARQRFREDYDFVKEKDSSGKTRLREIYKGDCYIRKLSPEKQKKQKYQFLLLLVAADCGYLFTLFTASPENSIALIGMLTILQLIPMYFMNAGCIRNIWVKKKMTRLDYKSTSLTIRYGACVCMCYAVFMLVSRLTWVAIFGGITEPVQIIYVFVYVLLAVCSGIIWKIEKNTGYEVEKGEKHKIDVPEGYYK